jgi:hypothetical protein
MKLRITITLLFAALLNSAHALPAYSGNLTVQPLAETVALIDPTDLTTTFTINGTAALSTGILSRDPVPGVCFLNVGLVEHFPRGGSNGGRRASVFVGALKDNSNNDIWWQWDSGESGYPNGRYTERRIDNYTIRIYDLIHRGDSLAFKWVHLDDHHPEEEWVDFDFNNVKWNVARLGHFTVTERIGCCGALAVLSAALEEAVQVKTGVTQTPSRHAGGNQGRALQPFCGRRGQDTAMT